MSGPAANYHRVPWSLLVSSETGRPVQKAPDLATDGRMMFRRGRSTMNWSSELCTEDRLRFVVASFVSDSCAFAKSCEVTKPGTLLDVLFR